MRKVFLISFIPFLRYLPLNFNELLNTFFVNNSLYISITVLCILTIIAFIVKKKIIYWSIVIVLFQIFLGHHIQNICNHAIILINKGENVDNFKNPFLGMKMEKGDNYAIFNYENQLSTYKSLLFEKSHGIDDHELNFELSEVIKVYNEDWYLILND